MRYEGDVTVACILSFEQCLSPRGDIENNVCDQRVHSFNREWQVCQPDRKHKFEAYQAKSDAEFQVCGVCGGPTDEFTAW